MSRAANWYNRLSAGALLSRKAKSPIGSIPDLRISEHRTSEVIAGFSGIISYGNLPLYALAALRCFQN
jgi:hypothetical protein